MQKEKRLIVVVDGMGAGIGRGIVERLSAARLNADIIVVGTNSAATQNMMKPGVTAAATGENACVYNCERADIIIGPIGIIVANAMNGEISPKMAMAISSSNAERILIPIQNTHIRLAGVASVPLGKAMDDMLRLVQEIVAGSER